VPLTAVHNGPQTIVELNAELSTPFSEQIREQITAGIAAGTLSEGKALVPIREPAMRLGTKGTVAKAYNS
jgi:DNA-binding transcriptional regulator YhcF (GntR family)